MKSNLIFTKHSRNPGGHLPDCEEGFALKNCIRKDFLRNENVLLPEVTELDAVRHFTQLSQKNFCVDTNFYPLGSCTMKYNPKSFDQITSWPFFARIHPYQETSQVQGMLQVIVETEAMLSEVTGMDAFSLQPAAGAQGEFAGLLMTRAYHEHNKQQRNKVLIPDSAHGTNPASAALCGYEAVQVKTDAEGRVDLEDLKSKAGNDVACFMMTNPNTLGLFEKNILEISKVMHECGSLLYYDGANMNALLGIARPGDMGFDIVHVNLHKTFAVPHGSGGPGSGPVGVKAYLEPFLPYPRISKDDGGLLKWNYTSKKSIGRLRSFYGNCGAFLRSYCYIRALGGPGLRRVSEEAVINANYLKQKLKSVYAVPFKGHCMHEFVCSSKALKPQGGTALNIAKRLLDFGFHAPTVYFPLIVEEALMIEPTETESKQTLDAFIEAMLSIAEEVKTNPERLRQSPLTTPVKRLDEVRAARQPDLAWNPNATKSETDHDSGIQVSRTCCA